ncbi:tRNA (adenosine(37)-N6)-threonylcarbamoyltransferase complex dimerization subunit type 1 TsaB [bacterium]|nr:tRNA (adenosine(37)-N6)-threonylcarbamoyltransferase complex dimerization subunit type 1 TsaB [bacterium]MBU1071759.1 tRNA (adenosine(37)-N6)-threonylcarbamoyltransferase complex dimerization subunit type 1 TsaB [bacterium]MBU1675868.1 tRNA (adenosine(37)-N6)-threonylcarbamoyltransferase complex dimerization subunit type 1 TsaB [bacterium]
MLCLALDTSTTWGRFAIAEDGNVLRYQPFNVTGTYADALLPVIDDLLDAAGRDRRDLDAVAVCRGPGSFTGVRIGVATAKGMAWSLGCSLYAVSTLEAMAGAMLAENQAYAWAVPVLDARRGEVFAAVYRRRDDWVEEILPPAPRRPDACWRELLAAVPSPEASVYAGNGVSLLLGEGPALRAELQETGSPRVRPWESAHPATARAVAWAISRDRTRFTEVHPFVLTPAYLRVSDAEVKRGLDLTPRSPRGAAPRRGEDV